MAEFVSTTLPTYSDPLRAQSIKALEQRHKEMMAQSAAAGAITPENTQTPIQGFGHLANQLGDNFQRARVDQAAAAQRQMLAQTMAGMDPNNPKPHEIAAINSADPEMARQIMTQLAEYRRAQMQDTTTRRSQDMQLEATQGTNRTSLETNQKTVDATVAGQANQAAMETARLEAAKAAAAEKARLDEIAKGQDQTFTAAQAAQKVLDDQAAAAKLAETHAATAKEAARIKAAEEAADPKRIEAEKVLEQEARTARDMVSELSIVHGDLQKGIYTGRGSGIATVAGQLPGVGEYIGDPEKAARTDRFDVAMRKVATMDMSKTLKGSSTDKEMAEFRTLWNSPNATLDQKRQAFIRVLNAAKQDEVIGQAALERLGPKRLVPGGPEAAVAAKEAAKPVDPVAEAQDAINRGAPYEEVVKRFGGDASVLKRKVP